MDNVLNGGFKHWYVVRMTIDHAEKMRAAGNTYLRTEPCVSFETIAMATWFRTRGQAIDAVDGWNLDFRCLVLIRVQLNVDKLEGEDVGWAP
jgi:hypothetical protein